MKKKFPTPFSVRSFQAFISSHSDIFLGIIGQSGLNVFGYLFLSLLPVMLSFYFGGEKMAGVIISLFTGIQAFLFTPLGGKLMEKFSLIGLYKASIGIEILGAILWYIIPGKWGVLCFALAILFRISLLATDPLILRLGEKDKGGFWFSLRDQFGAFAAYSGLMIFPFFVLPHSWDYFPLIILGVEVIMLGVIWQIKNTIPAEKAEKKEYSHKNFFSPIEDGMRFIVKNNNYPLFYIGSNLFEGIFLGGIWFLFPLYVTDAAILQSGSEYTLGIYEIITVFFAAVAGIIADRISWKKIEVFSWSLTLVLAWLMCFYNSVLSLIVIGFFIGLSNNFFAAAGYHALAQFNNDPKDEKSFTMLSRILMNTGFMVSPLVCGILYSEYGFSTAMGFIAFCVSVIGVWMVYLVRIVR